MTTKRKFPYGIVVMVLIGWVLIVIATLHNAFWEPGHTISTHHIQHLLYLAGGSLWGIAAAQFLENRRPRERRQGKWLIPALLAPMAAMFIMWPSTYAYVEARPLLHMSEHAVFIILGIVTTYGGWQWATVTSWLLGGSLAAMSLFAAFFFGVGPGPNPAVEAILSAESPRSAIGGGPGQEIFESTCASCHNTTGAGLPGAFPPLAGHFTDLLEADGQDYVVNVVLFGLEGPITVDDQNYNGFMPPQDHLSDEEVADVLNYVSAAWGNALPAGMEAFSPDMTAAVRGRYLEADDVARARKRLTLP